MEWIGLTGGIASGKSTAKKLIEGLGYPVIDADLVAHKLSEKGAEGYRQIVSHFGTEILTKDLAIDRKILGSLVFKNAELKLKLENILHPLIQADVQKLKIQYSEAGQTICFYDVPLLFEKNLKSRFDSVVLIWCNRDQQISRLILRNQLSVDEAELRVNAQLPMIEKVKRSHHCIDNSTDEANLSTQIKNLLQTLG